MKRLSISYSLFKLGLKILKVKDKQNLQLEKYMDLVSESNRKINLKIPKSNKLSITEHKINDTTYYLGKHKAAKSKGLVIILHGGGFLTELSQAELNYGKSIGEESGLDVLIPNLPSCITHSIDQVYDSLSEMYMEATKGYEGNIAILGFSSGAAISIGICIHLRENYKTLPLPKLVIASSPGSVALYKDEFNKMWELENKDIMVSTQFMLSIGNILQKDKQIPEYMLFTAHSDFNSLPPIYFLYGTDEILLAFMPSYKAACEKAGVEAYFTVKEGMCHCYPGMPFKEGKKATAEIVELLKETLLP